ncbi:MAG: DUF917 family protein [Candidatus Sumerlaeia bacterium]|nr:DUF917 family protein [Candidatus Sumerlaeia bacterium]
MSYRIDDTITESAILGGAVLGGGGGGWIKSAKQIAKLARANGFAKIYSLTEIPDDALLLTVSAVGAPSAGSGSLAPEDYVRAVELFLTHTGLRIAGLISSEVGALGVVNGWLPSALLKVPLIDAPCNGRAHPLALMGSMGLHRKKNYVSIQTAVGGSTASGNRIELFLQGSLEAVSSLIRTAAIKSGGMVAVARNPVPARYVRKNGAPGAIAMAIRAGKIIRNYSSAGAIRMVKKLVRFFGNGLMFTGKVQQYTLNTENGLDVGTILVSNRTGVFELTFWNEYMTLECNGNRVATFPDLIMTFDASTGMPLISAEIQEQQEVIILTVPAEKLILGAGMRDQKLLARVETAIGKKLVVKWGHKKCRKKSG